MGYQKRINERLLVTQAMDVRANEVEAMMRLEHPTLDGLSAARFDSEVDLCVELVRRQPDLARAVAASMGL